MRKMRKFKVDDIVVIKNNNDMPLYKSESVYRIVDFYKSSIDDKYYYAIELAEPSSDYSVENLYLNCNMIQFKLLNYFYKGIKYDVVKGYTLKIFKFFC